MIFSSIMQNDKSKPKVFFWIERESNIPNPMDEKKGTWDSSTEPSANTGALCDDLTNAIR